jgi:hypothetical protein
VGKPPLAPQQCAHAMSHLTYAYGDDLAVLAAMQGYLATIGRNKVGFSVVGHKPDGAPLYVGSTRGVVEHNTMRDCVAIEAYVGALAPRGLVCRRRSLPGATA